MRKTMTWLRDRTSMTVTTMMRTLALMTETMRTKMMTIMAMISTKTKPTEINLAKSKILKYSSWMTSSSFSATDASPVSATTFTSAPSNSSSNKSIKARVQMRDARGWSLSLARRVLAFGQSWTRSCSMRTWSRRSSHFPSWAVKQAPTTTDKHLRFEFSIIFLASIWVQSWIDKLDK